jgi:hypothetical protein
MHNVLVAMRDLTITIIRIIIIPMAIIGIRSLTGAYEVFWQGLAISHS